MSRLSAVMQQRVHEAEHAWNSRDCDSLVMSNAIDCLWRNRVYSLWGREQIRTFVERQLRREMERRVIMEPWAEDERRLAVRFASEFRNDSGSWSRAYGCEEMEFDDAGLIRRRFTTVNEHATEDHERVLRWAIGPRPDDHPPLTELGF
jgi:nuclear transport factor 2 (NTF2) superfamily protein